MLDLIRELDYNKSRIKILKQLEKYELIIKENGKNDNNTGANL